MTWTFDDLTGWDEKIRAIAKSYNLEWHPIDYEVCDYHDMIGYMAYTGMPTHYQHWSYGKSFERTLTLPEEIPHPAIAVLPSIMNAPANITFFRNIFFRNIFSK